MADEKRDYERNTESSSDLSRRDFVAISVAAGILAERLAILKYVIQLEGERK